MKLFGICGGNRKPQPGQRHSTKVEQRSLQNPIVFLVSSRSTMAAVEQSSDGESSPPAEASMINLISSDSDSDKWETTDEGSNEILKTNKRHRVDGGIKSKGKLLPDGFLDPLRPKKSFKFPGFSRSSTIPPTQSPPSISTQESVDSRPADNRQYLEPEGETFVQCTQASHAVVDIIKSKYDAPYLSWKKIPGHVRDIWFKEFEKKFYWLPHHHYLIRKNFERRGSIRLRDMFTAIRKVSKKPDWIRESIWEALCSQWRSPEYIKKRVQNKQNRASDCNGIGTSLHTSGSIPFTEHKRRMSKEMGKDPTLSELYARTHQRQKDKKWVDARSEKVYQEFMRRKEKQSNQGSTREGCSSGAKNSQLDFQIWTQMIGGKKKGRTYGLGSEANVMMGHSLVNQTSLSCGLGSHVQELVRREVATLTANFQAELAAERQQIYNKVFQMMNMPPPAQFQSATPPPSRLAKDYDGDGKGESENEGL